jgi:hypothetical protein
LPFPRSAPFAREIAQAVIELFQNGGNDNARELAEIQLRGDSGVVSGKKPAGSDARS